MQLARLYLDAGRVADAGSLLQTAYRQEACNDFTPLVDYLSAAGQLAGSKATGMPLPDFPLTFRRRAQLLVAVSRRLETNGRRAEACTLLLSHPGFLAEVPEAAAELCRNRPGNQREELIGCLKIALNQLQPPYPQLVRTLDSLQAPTGLSVPAESADRR